MILIGLTGSIGMGKSTTTAMFADRGAVVWNADDAVHRLYAPGGAAVAAVGAAFPGVVVDGAVDRTRLAEALGRDETAFRRLEAIVHPLVAAGRADDLEAARAAGVRLAVLDIPLLFETGGDAGVDAVVVVSADPAIQAGAGAGPPRHDARTVRGHSGPPAARCGKARARRFRNRHRPGPGSRARPGRGRGGCSA